MCQWCAEHGDGKRWYLNAGSYSADLLSDLRRQRLMRYFLNGGLERDLGRVPRALELLGRAPRFVQSLVRRAAGTHLQRSHFGQVVPLDDVEKILDHMGTVVRLPCLCRKVLHGEEAGYCLGIALDPSRHPFADYVDDSYSNGPDTNGLERIEVDEARKLMRQWAQEGIVHTCWAFVAPFIGNMCNCTRSDCLAMMATADNGVRAIWRGDCVAEVDWEKCIGCGVCVERCQFGAIRFSAADGRPTIEPTECWGCGVCRLSCPAEAISLVERTQVPAAADLW